jgi:hypothetical protein
MAALALALAARAGAAPPAASQDLPLPGDGFAWERVGDVPIDVFDLAFGPDGTLWATADDGPHRLDLAGGFPGVWIRLKQSGAFSGAILPLGRDEQGRDTLIATGGSRTRRSTDGGLSWTEVYDAGWEGLYEVPAGLPRAGRVLTGDDQAIGYSDDRGATFTDAVVPPAGSGPSGAYDFVALPPGSAYAGRVVASGNYGASLSDDGGATFRESALWGITINGERLGVVDRPGDGGTGGDSYRVLMGGHVSAQADVRVWRSDDGGETWEPDGGIRLPEGPPEGVGGGAKAVLSLGGPSAFVVLGRGTVYRTDDAGETWEAVGRAPDINDAIHLEAAALGSDGRLYVGLHEAGLARAWVWRTAEVVTASEPSVEPPAEEPLRVAVQPNPAHDSATVMLTLREPSEVEAVLYDGLGRRVAVLASGAFGAGRHALALDGSALPAGVYVVHLAVRTGSGGSAVAVRRITLMR